MLPFFEGATYLEQFISTEQLATASHWSLGKNRADVMMPAVGFQTDAEATALTELLHLSHLSWREEITTSVYIVSIRGGVFSFRMSIWSFSNKKLLLRKRIWVYLI